METILKIVEKRQAAEQSKVQLLDLAEKRLELEAEKQRKSEENFEQALLTFEETYPSKESQNHIIIEIIQNKYKLLNPSGKTARRIAILHWFNNIHEPRLPLRSEGIRV